MHDVPLNNQATQALAWRAAAGALPLWQSRVCDAVAPLSHFAEAVRVLSKFSQAAPLADADPLGALRTMPAPEISVTEEDEAAQEAERGARWPAQRRAERARPRPHVVAGSLTQDRLTNGANDQKRQARNAGVISPAGATAQSSSTMMIQTNEPQAADGTTRTRRSLPANGRATAPLASLERWRGLVVGAAASSTARTQLAQAMRSSSKEANPNQSADNATSSHALRLQGQSTMRRAFAPLAANGLAATVGDVGQGMSLVGRLVAQRTMFEGDVEAKAGPAHARSAPGNDDPLYARAQTRTMIRAAVRRAFVTPVSDENGREVRFPAAPFAGDASAGMRDLAQMLAPSPARREGLADVLARSLDQHERLQIETEDSVGRPSAHRLRERFRRAPTLPGEQAIDAVRQREGLAESLAAQALSQPLPSQPLEAGNHSQERLALDLPMATSIGEPSPTTHAMLPAVHNTFNVTVHMEGGVEGGLNDDLAARLTRILVDQARRYGIDV